MLSTITWNAWSPVKILLLSKSLPIFTGYKPVDASSLVQKLLSQRLANGCVLTFLHSRLLTRTRWFPESTISLIIRRLYFWLPKMCKIKCVLNNPRYEFKLVHHSSVKLARTPTTTFHINLSHRVGWIYLIYVITHIMEWFWLERTNGP